MAAAPITSDVRAPYSRRTIRSRPVSSAPRKNCSCQVGPIGMPSRETTYSAFRRRRSGRYVVFGGGRLGYLARVDRGGEEGQHEEPEERAVGHRRAVSAQASQRSRPRGRRAHGPATLRNPASLSPRTQAESISRQTGGSSVGAPAATGPSSSRWMTSRPTGRRRGRASRPGSTLGSSLGATARRDPSRRRGGLLRAERPQRDHDRHADQRRADQVRQVEA